MGRIGYAPMFARQEERHASVLAGDSDDTLFLLEHDPVVTLGKNSGLNGADNVRRSPPELEAMGIALHRSSRGGDVTYHGPGQLVGYPIVQLQEGEKDIRAFVWKIEQALIEVLHGFGIDASRDAEHRGVWVGAEKVAAIGLRVSRWTTMHGFALNVTTNLDHFGVIVPCGIEGRGVTSMQRLLGKAPSMHDVEERTIHHLARLLNRSVAEYSPETAVAG
jgi:lipoyl(octanoyl) transferase